MDLKWFSVMYHSCALWLAGSWGGRVVSCGRGLTPEVWLAYKRAWLRGGAKRTHGRNTTTSSRPTRRSIIIYWRRCTLSRFASYMYTFNALSEKVKFYAYMFCAGERNRKLKLIGRDSLRSDASEPAGQSARVWLCVPANQTAAFPSQQTRGTFAQFVLGH